MMKALLLILACGLSIGLSAEQKQSLGPWDVHYMAMPSTLVEPAIATQYKISRSQNNGLINISVLNTADQQAQAVQISGLAINLLGQQKNLEFKEVHEGKAIYYLAQLAFRGEEKLRFKITIQQEQQQQLLQFEHTFYPE